MWCIPLQCCFLCCFNVFLSFPLQPRKRPRWFLVVNLAIRAGNVRLVGLLLVRSCYDHFHFLFCALFNPTVTAVSTEQHIQVTLWRAWFSHPNASHQLSVGSCFKLFWLPFVSNSSFFLPYAHSMCLLIYLWVSYRPPSHTVWVGQGIFATKPHGGAASSPCCYWSSCYRLIFI